MDEYDLGTTELIGALEAGRQSEKENFQDSITPSERSVTRSFTETFRELTLELSLDTTGQSGRSHLARGNY